MGRRIYLQSAPPSSRDPLVFVRFSHDQDDSVVNNLEKNHEAYWITERAWEIAQAPFKNLLMMGFMIWMAGSTVHLFSIGITFSTLWQPVKAPRGVGKTFEPYKDSKVDLFVPKHVYINPYSDWLRLNTLGLLPVHVSDWVSSVAPAEEVEHSGGGIPLL